MKHRDMLTELRDKDIKALSKDVLEREQHLLKLRFDLAFRKLKNLHEIRNTRRQIARMTTILREKAAAVAASKKES